MNVLNGGAPYTYEWLNGQSTSVADSLIAGSYNVLITDVFGCTVTLTFDVNEPDSIWMGLTASDYTNGFNVTPHQGENGYIYSSVEGGLPPYNYTWSNGETTSDIYNLTAGEYYCFITDRNGCKVQASVMLVQPDILEMPSGYSPNLDGSNDNFVVHGIEAYPENELVIYNRWGNVVYTKTNYANEWAGDNTGGEPLPDATYFAILTIFGDEEIILKGYVDLRR